MTGRRTLRRGFLGFLLALAISAGLLPAGLAHAAGAPAAFTILAGDNQTVAVGETFAPVTVRLTDAAGQPVPDTRVFLTTTEGYAVIAGVTSVGAITGTDGTATFPGFVANGTGPVVRTASLVEFALATPVRGTVTGAIAPTTLAPRLGADLSTFPGGGFCCPLIMTVKDAAGGPLGGAPVRAVISGPAQFSPGGGRELTVASSALGESWFEFAADAVPGTATVTLTLGDLPPVVTTLRVVGDPLPADKLAAVSGGGQSAPAGSAFAAPLVVAATGGDRSLPIPGAGVVFSVDSGSATFPGGATTAVVPTGADGRATSPVLTAGGSAGPVSVSARTGGATPVTFPLTVTAPPAPATRADLVTTTSGASSVSPGRTAVVAVTVRNAGPATASRITTVITSLPGVRIASTSNGTVQGGTRVTAQTASLAVGASTTFTITLVADAQARGTTGIAGGAFATTPDPNVANNATVRTLRVVG